LAAMVGLVSADTFVCRSGTYRGQHRFPFGHVMAVNIQARGAGVCG